MTDTKHVVISETFSLGDAGFPFDTDIKVSYTETEDTVTVTNCEETDYPERAPSYWNDMIGEAVENFFHPKQVQFV